MNKYISKLSYAALLSMMVAGPLCLSSCDDDEEDCDTVDPVISYVRTTHPDQADSLLDAASLGQVIAICGENLQNVKAIMFNDVKAKLNLSYMTDNAIIVTVPKAVPGDITNNMYVVAKNGDTIVYPFTASIPAPILTSMDCEYVKAGEYAYINGNYFVNTADQKISVTFAGNVQGEVDEDLTTTSCLVVKVPEGAKPGAISVSTNFGTTNSSFWLNDNRYMLLDFETSFNGWGKHTTATEDGNTFVHFSGSTALWGWNEKATVIYSLSSEAVTYEAPTAYSAKDLALKFECRVNNTWSLVSLYIQLYKAGQASSNTSDLSSGYCWEPWSAGAYGPTDWVTVTIPLSDFTENSSGAADTFSAPDMSDFGGLFLFLRGGSGSDDKTEQEVDMDLDNFRIVPIN